MTETYHVVCRDCPFEELADAAFWAWCASGAHEHETGHAVVAGRIE